MKTRKADIYRAHGIEYKDGKILSPIGWVRPLLINGNTKLGRGVWTFSTLASSRTWNARINGEWLEVPGTCICTCDGCYGLEGNYRFQSVIDSLAKKTILARDFLNWTKCAILAQIQADGITIVRIHATGDFFSAEYVQAWMEIIKDTPGVVYWSYTKNPAAECAFDDLTNCNIVRSCIQGIGFNFGKCAYIIKAYKALKAAGKQVYICRCGIDKNQHCTNCHGCVKNLHVLFVLHGGGYHAEKDPDYAELKALIESQPRP